MASGTQAADALSQAVALQLAPAPASNGTCSDDDANWLSGWVAARRGRLDTLGRRGWKAASRSHGGGDGSGGDGSGGGRAVLALVMVVGSRGACSRGGVLCGCLRGDLLDKLGDAVVLLSTVRRQGKMLPAPDARICRRR